MQFSKCSNTCNSIQNVVVSVDTWVYECKIKQMIWVTDQTALNNNKWAHALNSGTVCYQFKGHNSLNTITHTWSINLSNHFSILFTSFQVPFLVQMESFKKRIFQNPITPLKLIAVNIKEHSILRILIRHWIRNINEKISKNINVSIIDTKFITVRLQHVFGRR